MFTSTLRIISLLLFSALSLSAQTSVFNYQGQLTDGGNPANGDFQMQFKLFNTLSSGTQIGATLNDVPVTAVAGVFRVQLDFGSSSFPGLKRFLEVAVRRNSGESYVVLSPREEILSSPYAMKSVSADTAANATNAANASQLGGLPPARYVQTDTNGNVGIGASPSASSRLTVGGQLQLTSGSIMFPDSTMQSTAGITSVTTTGPFTGNGTTASPLGIQTPLSVRELNPPNKQPFSMFVTSPTILTYVVPAGKLLVIEYVSGTSIRPQTGDYLPWYQFTINDSLKAKIPAKTWSDIATSRYWHFSEQIKLYVSAGQTLKQVQGTNEIFIQGYFVDVP